MKKLLISIAFSLFLVGCNVSNEKPLDCGTDQIIIDGVCVTDTPVCSDDEVLIEDKCVLKNSNPITCPNNQTNINNVCRNNSVLTQQFNLDDLESDFDYIVQYIEDHNPMLFTDRQKVDNTIATQRQLLEDDMTLLEFMRIIAPVVASFDCGRSGLILPNEINDYFYVNYYVFPLETRIVNQKLYVVKNYSDSYIELGSEITTINGISVEDILSKMQNGSSTNGLNETNFYSGYLNINFPYFYYLYIDEFAQEYEIQYIDHISQEIKILELDGKMRSNLGLEPWVNLPFEYIRYDDYAYLDVNSFIGWNGVNEFYDFFEDSFTDITNNNVEHLIIDLRDNTGGDSRLAADLFSYILETPQPYFDSDVVNSYFGINSTIQKREPHYYGEIYLLVNGGSSATTAQLIALIANQDLATIIGEEIGGSYSHSDEIVSSSSQFTNIIIQSSTTILSVLVSGDMENTPIVPDYEISLTLENYLNNTDDVINYAKSLIMNNSD